MKTKLKNNPVLMLATCLLSICMVLPLLSGAGNIDRAVLETRHNLIANMTQQERDRLREQYKTFKALSPQQQNQLREIHRQITSDRELQEIVRNYEYWLQSITIWQREEINRENDPIQRMKLIRKFLEKAEQKKTDNLSSSIANGNPRIRGMFATMPTLSNQELSDVMTMFTTRLKLSADEQTEIETLTGARRNLNILGLIVRRVDRADLRDNWPTADMLDKFFTLIPENRNVRARLDYIQAPEMKRQAIKTVVMKSIIDQWRAELKKTGPTDDEISQYFKQLTAEQQNQIMRMGSDNAKRLLVQKYHKEHQTPLTRQYAEIRRLMKEFHAKSGKNGSRPPRRKPRPDGTFRPPGKPKPPAIKRNEKKN